MNFTRCPYCGKGFYVADAPFICDLHDPSPENDVSKLPGSYPLAENARAETKPRPVLPLPVEIPWPWVKQLKYRIEDLLGRSLPPTSMQMPCGHTSYKQRCIACRATLPDNTRNAQTFVVSLLGPPFVGKSHYLAAAVDTLVGDDAVDRPGLMERHSHTMRPIAATQEEYRERYYRPVYEQRETLAVTPPLHISHTARVPLVYEIRSQTGGAPATNLSLFDVPGETALDRRDLVKHGEHILNSDAVICMIGPSGEGGDARTVLDPEGRKAIEKLIEAAERHHGRKGRGRRAMEIPIAVVITKSDVLAERGLLPAELGDSLEHRSLAAPGLLDDTMRLSRGLVEGCRELRDLPARLEKEFSKVGYFAVSSLGFRPDGTKLIRRPEPHRVEEPLLWLLACRGDSLWARR